MIVCALAFVCDFIHVVVCVDAWARVCGVCACGGVGVGACKFSDQGPNLFGAGEHVPEPSLVAQEPRRPENGCIGLKSKTDA